MPPKKNRCTACNERILSAFDAHLHPLLKCLVCRSCRDNYGTGDFSVFESGVDSDGDDNYCRWCVDGGDLFGCANSKDGNKCHYSFCQECIERNLPQDQVLHQDDLPANHNWKWSCLACDRSKLKKHRQEAQEAILALSQKDLKRNNSASGSRSFEQPMDIDIVSNSDEPSESAKKRRKTETNGSGDKVVETKESSKETTRESTRDSTRDSNKDSTRETSSKSSNREPTKDVPMEPNRTESSRESASARELAREPEACLMPQVEKPRPPKTSLRNLNSDSRPQKPMRDRPSSTTSSLSTGPTSLSARIANSLSAKSLGTPPSSSSSSSSKPSTSSTSVPKPAAQVSASSRPSTASISSSGSKQTTATTTKPTANATKQPEAGAKSKPLVPIVTINDDNTTATSAPHRANSVTTYVEKLRPVSKQLKSSNEQIVPTTKVQLSESDLKKRLENYGKVKEKCVKEIDRRFQTILEMFASKDEECKLILKSQIEDLESPIQEFNTMLLHLKSLYHSQK